MVHSGGTRVLDLAANKSHSEACGQLRLDPHVGAMEYRH